MRRKFGYTFGTILILLGLIWIGQGSGFFPYPSSSFMINQSIWILWGLIVLGIGGVAVFVTRRLGGE
ncbi:hypothetical protein [Rhizobium sullae]|uniref:Uncharacterized protein n=1 Tax=Rhizobium sullae TaxID=50338 RepID=A0A2N0DB79_RHISU|nr:hypothetical protein [Rhizobium sullae]PKA43348.1 hypothetical protein CWR43_10220 [Rhizobium sullae]TCU13363.1 hypothetical protein EV132_11261 [Rhizobium sullae]UWU18774.1 hypothetical protein N2599_26675 [Rhizobium sullae]